MASGVRFCGACGGLQPEIRVRNSTGPFDPRAQTQAPDAMAKPMRPAERAEIMNGTVNQYVENGWELREKTPFTATLYRRIYLTVDQFGNLRGSSVHPEEA